MMRQEPVIRKQEVIGVLHIAEWGVTFDPIDQRPAFNQARLATWETVEAAKLAILKAVNEQGDLVTQTENEGDFVTW